jgi:hypothetical protein
MEELQKKKVVETFEISDAYTVLIEPLKQEIESLKYAYKVEGKEAAELKGYYRGLSYILDLIDMYKREGEVQSTKVFQDSPLENKII